MLLFSDHAPNDGDIGELKTKVASVLITESDLAEFATPPPPAALVRRCTGPHSSNDLRSQYSQPSTGTRSALQLQSVYMGRHADTADLDCVLSVLTRQQLCEFCPAK